MSGIIRASSEVLPFLMVGGALEGYGGGEGMGDGGDMGYGGLEKKRGKFKEMSLKK